MKIITFWLAMSMTTAAQAFCFNEAGTIYQIDPKLLKAIAQQESNLSTMFSTSVLQGATALIFFAFLALFIYLDAASRCSPCCFTLAFGMTGVVFRFSLSPESVLPAPLVMVLRASPEID